MDRAALMFLLIIATLSLISTISSTQPSETDLKSSKVNPSKHTVDTVNPGRTGVKRDVSITQSDSISYHETTQPRRASKRVEDAYGPPQPPAYYPHHSHDPEPIIEIIIKDSNESLPAPPPVYTPPPPKPTKEPVQVFYVKYKKNPNSQHGKEDEIIYEPPIPALTPPTNNHDLEINTPSHTEAYTTPAPLPPRPSTTLRTIIHPDSEIYHGTGGVKVTFGKTEIHHHPAPVLTHREDSSPITTSDHVSKRDSQAAGSDLQPVRRNPEYRSPILNQNEFQALPPDYFNKNKDFNGPFRGPPNDYNVPSNSIGDFPGPFKNGPPRDFNGAQDFGGNNFDGRIRNGPIDGPVKYGSNDVNNQVRGPQNYEPVRGQQQQNFNGPPRNGPSFDSPVRPNFENGPVRNGQNFDSFRNERPPFDGPGPVRNGPSNNFEGPSRNRPDAFDGPVRNGPNNFEGPVRNGPKNFNGPVRNGPSFEGPIRNGPNFETANRNVQNNYNRLVDRPVGGDSYSPQASNNFPSRPNTNGLTKVAFPGEISPQQYQRPAEIQSQGPVYKQPNQSQQPQYQQNVRQEKPFVPSQPIYSPQELYQPPQQYQQNTYNVPNVDQSKRPSQIQGFQQASLKTPPMQHFSTNDVIRKPAQVPNYEQQFTKKPVFDPQQFLQPGGKTYISPVKQSQEIASFDESIYSKPTGGDSNQLQQQKQLYELQKQQEIERQQQAQLQQLQQQYYALQSLQQVGQDQQQYSKAPQETQTESLPHSFLQQQQQIHYTKAPPPSIYNNVEQQNNLFVQNEQSLNALKPGTELSNEEYQLLLEKQRLAQVKLLKKDRENYQQANPDQIKYQQPNSEQQKYQQSNVEQQKYQQSNAEQQKYQQSNLEQQNRQLQQAAQLQQQKQQEQLLLQQQQQQANQQRLQNHRLEQHQSQQSEQQQGVSKLSQYQTSKKTQDVYAKPTTFKYVSSTQPTVKYQQSSTTSQATTAAPETSTEFTKEQKEKFNKNLLALPDEVPEDIRQQLLSSGILGNADIQILDYDKVGDIPIENLPPEALANFYGGGGAAQKRSSDITKRSVDNAPSASSGDKEGRSVAMKVVQFNPNTPEGQQLAQSYLQGQQAEGQHSQQTTEVVADPVVLNDSSYNRYLPLKVHGASFPLPNSELLRNRRITSVVVLAPVDYESVVGGQSGTGSDHVTTQGSVQTHDHRDGKAVQVQGVHFVSGNILNELIKNPTEGNFKHWLGTEKQFPVSKQSIVLLVTNPLQPTEQRSGKEVYMYDFNTDNVSVLNGDLSETFLQVAESNAASDELDNVYHDQHQPTPTPTAPNNHKEELAKGSEDNVPKQVIKRQS